MSLTRVEPKDLIKDIPNNLYLALKNSIYPGAADESIALVWAYCDAANLDPMLKPVHIVPMYVEDKSLPKKGDYYQKIKRDVIMPGIGLYRIQANRTGQYAGISEPEFGEEVTAKLGAREFTFPKWCKVTVKKNVDGKIYEFTAKEFWLENYATKSKDDKAPNAMWEKRPYAQISKCCESQCLRKAFPELGSQLTAEEMEGKTFDSDEIAELEKNAKTVIAQRTDEAKQKTQKILNNASKALPKQQPVESDNIDPVTGEIRQKASDDNVTVGSVLNKINAAKTKEEAEMSLTTKKKIVNLSDADNKKIDELYGKKIAKLQAEIPVNNQELDKGWDDFKKDGENE